MVHDGRICSLWAMTWLEHFPNISKIKIRVVEELDMAEEEKSNARSGGWCFMLREDFKIDEICKKRRRWGGGEEDFNRTWLVDVEDVVTRPDLLRTQRTSFFLPLSISALRLLHDRSFLYPPLFKYQILISCEAALLSHNIVELSSCNWPENYTRRQQNERGSSLCLYWVLDSFSVSGLHARTPIG